MLAAGLKNIKIWNEPNKWQYKIVDPLKIELPTALATVVTHWNKPMHDFLKKCKFLIKLNFNTYIFHIPILYFLQMYTNVGCL